MYRRGKDTWIDLLANGKAVLDAVLGGTAER